MPIAHVEESWQMAEFYNNKVIYMFSGTQSFALKCYHELLNYDICYIQTDEGIINCFGSKN